MIGTGTIYRLGHFVDLLHSLKNLLAHFQWTPCRHERREYGPKYFPYCMNCGAVFSDYLSDEEIAARQREYQERKRKAIAGLASGVEECNR